MILLLFFIVFAVIIFFGFAAFTLISESDGLSLFLLIIPAIAISFFVTYTHMEGMQTVVDSTLIPSTELIIKNEHDIFIYHNDIVFKNFSARDAKFIENDDFVVYKQTLTKNVTRSGFTVLFPSPWTEYKFFSKSGEFITSKN